MEREPESRRVTVRRSGEFVTGRRVGERYLRLPRQVLSQRIAVPRPRPRHMIANPAVLFVAGFAALILAGTVALSLPLATAAGEAVSPLTALFTATSAVCVTGLVLVDTGTYWSGMGQATILVLIQLGGLGFMTSSTLLWLLLGQRLSLRQRLLLREALGGGALGELPLLVRRILAFTFLAEVAGAAVLTARFLGEVDPGRALWWGVFHAVAAFNNAGFDVLGGFRSLTAYQHDPLVLLPIAALIVLGGISYTVIEDLVRHRQFQRLALDSKLVLITTATLLVVGALGLLVTEGRNPRTLGALEPGARLLNVVFHSVTPRTAGFNSLDVGQMTDEGLLLTIALMFIGGAAGSTAGGIKVQTFSLLVLAALATLRGLDEVQAFERRVRTAHVYRALTTLFLAIVLVASVSFLLSALDGHSYLPLLFETVSAFGTVGLSTGITPELSPVAQLLLIFTMFVGRLGPLTVALALVARERPLRYRWPEGAVRIG